MRHRLNAPARRLLLAHLESEVVHGDPLMVTAPNGAWNTMERLARAGCVERAGEELSTTTDAVGGKWLTRLAIWRLTARGRRRAADLAVGVALRKGPDLPASLDAIALLQRLDDPRPLVRVARALGLIVGGFA